MAAVVLCVSGAMLLLLLPPPSSMPCLEEPVQTAGPRLGGSIHVSSNGSVSSAERANVKKGPWTGLLDGQLCLTNHNMDHTNDRS